MPPEDYEEYGCYCHDNVHGYRDYFGFDGYLKYCSCLEEIVLEIDEGSAEGITYVPGIKYCPFCGKAVNQ